MLSALAVVLLTPPISASTECDPPDLGIDAAIRLPVHCDDDGTAQGPGTIVVIDGVQHRVLEPIPAVLGCTVSPAFAWTSRPDIGDDDVDEDYGMRIDTHGYISCDPDPLVAVEPGFTFDMKVMAKNQALQASGSWVDKRDPVDSGWVTWDPDPMDPKMGANAVAHYDCRSTIWKKYRGKVRGWVLYEDEIYTEVVRDGPFAAKCHRE